jgi:toxin YoeB
MEVIFSPQANEDLNFWKKRNDSKTLKRIRLLVENIIQDPFHGIGKPEPLKCDLRGMWSRRINQKDRVIYEVDGDLITIHAVKEHY